MLEEQWADPEFLLQFFKANETLLSNSIYSHYTVREAVLKTIKDAQILFNQLYDIAEAGFEDPQENLSQFFVPLHKSDAALLVQHQQCKAYGLEIADGWLRLYAIRLSANSFIITGGGIKLVRTMQESILLNNELTVLKNVQQFLIDHNILDVDDIVSDNTI
ncbi:hypothetical protein EI546_03365 [Aequorivita sp. H23M31]|uniref:Uncharacterized protein n=1 Tax=Aequorivita ciconiae TaxID=2494375 RepID=A0A410G0Q3_9FLAO|nr:hypothetical protein [Aequorivita sp. H23M31]QAA80825.1 hypothetical protein EI546_03365 [Aequorivita sp. H23M31]